MLPRTKHANSSTIIAADGGSIMQQLSRVRDILATPCRFPMQFEIFKPDIESILCSSQFYPTHSSRQYAIDIARRRDRPSCLHCGECERTNLKGVGLTWEVVLLKAFPTCCRFPRGVQACRRYPYCGTQTLGVRCQSPV